MHCGALNLFISFVVSLQKMRMGCMHKTSRFTRLYPVLLRLQVVWLQGERGRRVGFYTLDSGHFSSNSTSQSSPSHVGKGGARRSSRGAPVARLDAEAVAAAASPPAGHRKAARRKATPVLEQPLVPCNSGPVPDLVLGAAHAPQLQLQPTPPGFSLLPANISHQGWPGSQELPTPKRHKKSRDQIASPASPLTAHRDLDQASQQQHPATPAAVLPPFALPPQFPQTDQWNSQPQAAAATHLCGWQPPLQAQQHQHQHQQAPSAANEEQRVASAGTMQDFHVQCDACDKWRKLPLDVKVSDGLHVGLLSHRTFGFLDKSKQNC